MEQFEYFNYIIYKYFLQRRLKLLFIISTGKQTTVKRGLPNENISRFHATLLQKKKPRIQIIVVAHIGVHFNQKSTSWEVCKQKIPNWRITGPPKGDIISLMKEPVGGSKRC